MAISERDVEIRRAAPLLRIQNPNYFGNLTELGILDSLPKPIVKKIGDTSFEELTCLGFNPDTDILTAIVRIKKGSGYSGGPCTDGSQEFVRFYLDYGDGSWVDHGVASFAIHDLGFRDDLCYAASIKVAPKRRTCCDAKPVLPKVRAILSWDDLPPANLPNWPPVWGNVLERDIQVEPRHALICAIEHLLDKAGTVAIDPDLIKQLKLVAEETPAPKPIAATAELAKAVDKGAGELHVLRTLFPVLGKAATAKDSLAALKSVSALKALKIDLSKFDDFVLKPKFDTTYEELRCVGYDRNLDQLHGIVRIKRSSGYSGDLCKAGSREYIAFYLDFGDGAGWQYQGTTWVTVHDVAAIPKNGLWYQASLPVNLDEHRKKWCQTGRAKIRGILSWSTKPVPNDPDHVAHWGDWEDCWIEIKPLPKGVDQGEMTAVLEAIGSMPVDRIDGAGYAEGWSVGATFKADDSPFGGVIKISGVIAFPTSSNLEYRVMIKAPSDASPQPWTKSFKVDVTTVNGGSVSHSNPTQTATGGWFDYIPQAGPPFKSVAEDLLARFTATEEGLHTVYVQVREVGSTTILATSFVEAFIVDNSRPQVDIEITSGTGNCGKFGVGDVISGTFSMTDKHAHSLSISVTPGPEADGGTIRIDSAAPAGAMAAFPVTETAATIANPTGADPTKTVVSMSYAAAEITTAGVTAGTWTLETAGMLPCGYNIRIRGVDRTIVNSGWVGWEAWDIEGFCVE
jgi:hypothetical protein